jgi:predicted Zn-dependent protease
MFSWVKSWWRKDAAAMGTLCKAGLLSLLMFVWIAAGGCSRVEAHFYGKAEGAQRVGSYGQAVELYQDYLKRYPQGEFAEKSQYNLGNIYYLNLRDSAKAQMAYEKFLKKYPTSQYAFTAGERLAELYEMDLKDFRKAVDILEQISLHTPSRDDWCRVRYKIANDYFRLDEFDQAIIEYRKVINDSPDDHRADEARVKVAAIYEIRKQWHDAIEQLQQVITESKCEECRRHSQLEIVDCYASLERYDQAIAVLRQVSVRPEDHDFIAQRLATLEQQKNQRQAPKELSWKKAAEQRRASSKTAPRRPARRRR